MQVERIVTPVDEPLWVSVLPSSLRQRLAGRTGLFVVLHNSGWLLFDKFVRLFLGLAIGAWVARYLGPNQFGQLAYALAYIAFFQAIANLGMDGIIVRDIAQKHENASHVLATAFTLRLLVGVLCWLGAVGGMWISGDRRSALLVALAGGSLVFQAADTLDLWFQSQSQSRRTVSAKLIALFFSSGIKVWLILAHAPLVAFAAVTAVEALMAAFALFIAYRRYPADGRWIVTSKASALLKESWPFILGGLSVMVYIRIDQIMIKEMLGEKELGIFSAVLPLSTLWQIIPIILVTSVAPLISRKRLENENAYKQLLANIFRLLSALGYLVCVPIALLSGPLVMLIFGRDYAEGSRVLAIHVFTNIFVNLGVAQGLWILNEKKGLIGFYKTLLGAIICVVANLVLIPRMGISGAALSAVFAQMGAAVISNVFFSPNILVMQLRSMLLLPSATKKEHSFA